MNDGLSAIPRGFHRRSAGPSPDAGDPAARADHGLSSPTLSPLGFLWDRLGRRKLVIVGGAAVLLGRVAWVLYGKTGILPPYVVGIVMGIVAGAGQPWGPVMKVKGSPVGSKSEKFSMSGNALMWAIFW